MKGGKQGRPRKTATGGAKHAAKGSGKGAGKSGAKVPANAPPKKGSRKKGFGGMSSTGEE